MSKNSSLDRATPESQGVASSAIAEFVAGVEAQRLGLHSFMLLRHGKVVAEAWWQPFAPDLPHILYSLTKSFTSTAAGFAIIEGRLSLDDPILSFFPRAAPRRPSENWSALRVRHLLSMTTGHEADATGVLVQHPPKAALAALFQTPLLYAPGTHFVYNSVASHLVSIILQKVTGQKLINYLADRLFRPLGIRRPHWETDPLGHNFGGWGLFLRTDEIARFGQTLLQRGQWQGQQVIPASWIEQATRKQVSNGNDPTSDWAQGYGFQYWMSRHGYRGDGAFGQFCVVLPEHDALLVTTAASPNMQGVLNVAWQTLLPALKSDPLPEDRAALSDLRQCLAQLETARPQGESTAPPRRDLAGQTYHFDSNPLGWQTVRVEPAGQTTDLTLSTTAGEQVVRCGMTGWQAGKLALDMPMVVPVAATARWTDENSLHTAITYLNAGSTRSLKLRFAGDEVALHTTLTDSFAPSDEVMLAGRAR